MVSAEGAVDGTGEAGTDLAARTGAEPVAAATPTAARRSIVGLDATRLVALAAPVGVAILVVANAWGTLMPGVGFWDTGEFQTVLPLMGTAHPTGYPTYVLVGWLVNLLLTPIGEPAFRITVLSLLAVAVAAGAMVALVRRLTDSAVVAVGAGLGLALTPIVWQISTLADPHALHLMFVALLMLALVRWADGRADGLDRRRIDRRLVLAAVVFGLSAGNHSLSLLLVPPIALYVLAVEPGILRRPLFIAACLGAAALTMALVFLELPIRGGVIPAPLVYGRPATWDGFWYIALAEQFRGSLGDVFANLPAKLDDLVALTRTHFGLVGFAIPPAFVLALRKAPRYTLLSGLALVITVLFNQAYANAWIERYYLGPVFWIWTWLAIAAAEVAGLAAMLLAGANRAGAADRSTARRSEAVAAAIVSVVLLLPALTEYDTNRRLADRSADVGAARWLDEALPALEPNAVIVSWWSTSTPLWYAQKVQGRRPDVFIVDDRTMLDLDLGRAPDVIRRFLGQRPVYAIRIDGPDLNELKGQFDMTLVAGSSHDGVWKVNGTGVTAQ